MSEKQSQSQRGEKSEKRKMVVKEKRDTETKDGIINKIKEVSICFCSRFCSILAIVLWAFRNYVLIVFSLGGN